MNEHIELVKKFLDDNDSVTKEELKANKDAAYDAARAAAEAAEAAFWAYEAAADVAYYGTNSEYCKNKAREAIAEYEELTK